MEEQQTNREDQGEQSGDAAQVVGEPGVPAAISDTGCERELNEDRYAVIECASGISWLVCDGMGGVAGGELAAQLAIDAIKRDLERMPSCPPDVALKSAILEANRIIVLRRQNPAFSQMGTTVVGVVFSGREVALGHAGDSRAYAVNVAGIRQLTTDHTYVQELVERGEISQQEAMSHPQAHILTRCLGSEPALQIGMRKFWIWDAAQGDGGDTIVLCSDGLYSLVTDVEIAQVVKEQTPQGACIKLVELAKSRGGYDNITLAVIPLGGRLETEAPGNYTAMWVLNQQKESRKLRNVEPATGSWTKVFLATAALSVLTCLVTVMVMALQIAR